MKRLVRIETVISVGIFVGVSLIGSAQYAMYKYAQTSDTAPTSGAWFGAMVGLNVATGVWLGWLLGLMYLILKSRNSWIIKRIGMPRLEELGLGGIAKSMSSIGGDSSPGS